MVFFLSLLFLLTCSAAFYECVLESFSTDIAVSTSLNVSDEFQSMN